jgi:hypothetical protein
MDFRLIAERAHPPNEEGGTEFRSAVERPHPFADSPQVVSRELRSVVLFEWAGISPQIGERRGRRRFAGKRNQLSGSTALCSLHG